MPYLTPTVGLFIEAQDYLNFLLNLHAADATHIEFEITEEAYPIGITPYTKLHFYHAESPSAASESFKRRYARVEWERALYKIDFGKPGYTGEHIRQWNSLKLPNSIAFYSEQVAAKYGNEIHNGVLVSDWVLDGAEMFDITRRYFDIFKWINKGQVELSPIYKIINCLLFDPLTLRRLKKFVISWAK